MLCWLRTSDGFFPKERLDWHRKVVAMRATVAIPHRMPVEGDIQRPARIEEG